jgi:hypothetical protein
LQRQQRDSRAAICQWNWIAESRRQRGSIFRNNESATSSCRPHRDGVVQTAMWVGRAIDHICAAFANGEQDLDFRHVSVLSPLPRPGQLTPSASLTHAAFNALPLQPAFQVMPRRVQMAARNAAALSAARIPRTTLIGIPYRRRSRDAEGCYNGVDACRPAGLAPVLRTDFLARGDLSCAECSRIEPLVWDAERDLPKSPRRAFDVTRRVDTRECRLACHRGCRALSDVTELASDGDKCIVSICPSRSARCTGLSCPASEYRHGKCAPWLPKRARAAGICRTLARPRLGTRPARPPPRMYQRSNFAEP